MIPQSHLIKQVFLILVTLLVPLHLKAQTNCQPSSDKMTQLFIDSLKALPESKTKLLFLPFQDTSRLLAPEETLSKAFVISGYDLISPFAAIYHPYVSFQATQRLTQEQLFETEQGQKIGKEIGSTHVVMGQFQKHQENSIRVFIKIIDVSSGKALGPPLEFITQESDRFFSVMGDISQTILQLTSTKKISANLFQTYLSTSPSFAAFRYYIKGLEKSDEYNLVDLEVAKAWFEKAAAISYGYSDAQAEKKRVLWMLSLYNRQMGKDISLLMTELRQETVVVSDSHKKFEGASKITHNRWEKAADLFLKSMHSTDTQALILLSQASSLTPEDSLIHYEQARRTKQLGKAYEAFLNQAREINSCVQSL